jgi:hypothetical protein
MKHRNILSLHAVYDTDLATLCVIDLSVGGTLFDLVAKQRARATSTGCSKRLNGMLAGHYAYQHAPFVVYAVPFAGFHNGSSRVR